LTIVSDVLGQTTQIFLPSKDGGRDGAFYGKWSPVNGQGVDGPGVIQVKFTAKAGTNLSILHLEDELEKAKKLAKMGLCRNYILITNYGLSGKADEKIVKAFRKIKGIDACWILGRDWIDKTIRESPRLRMLVPRIYGLGDLSQILDERKYQQAKVILAAMGEDLSKFVITDAYKRAARALVDPGFVLLLGEPAAGKSSIAACLALGAVDEWGCTTLKLQDASEFAHHWNPNEPKQFFWFDDVFGATQYQQGTTDSWNKAFPGLNAAIKRGARVVFTSRDYIFRGALPNLKISAFPLLKQSQVIINVQELSTIERQQILYNHIRRGDQKADFRTGIKRFLPKIASNSHFLPETARRLGNSFFTKNLTLTEHSLTAFVESPVDFLYEVVGTLDKHSKAALALIFMNGGALSSPIKLDSKQKEAIERLGSDSGDVREALLALDTSLVRLVSEGESKAWRLKHPTIADAISKHVADDPELLDVYIAGTSPERLIQEVVCVGVALEGARVKVPEGQFSLLMSKLKALKSKDALYRFLANRASDAFLTKYVESYPTLVDELCDVHSYLAVVPEPPLLFRLHKIGFVSEDQRRSFVERVKYLAVNVPDSDWLTTSSVRDLMKDDEVKEILALVKSELLPVLRKKIEEIEEAFDTDSDPDDHFYWLQSTLRGYQDEFTDDDDANGQLDAAMNGIAEAEERLRQSISSSEQDYDEHSGSMATNVESSRDIFDDVDR